MPYDRSGTLVYQYRLESRTYRMALLIASRGPSALAELLVPCRAQTVTDIHTTETHTQNKITDGTDRPTHASPTVLVGKQRLRTFY